MSKLLLITPSFPPVYGSQTQRMMAVANGLVNNGFDVSVLTSDPGNNHPYVDHNLINYVDKRIQVFRAPLGFLHRTVYKKNDSIVSKKKSLLRKLMNRFKKTLLFPDSMIDWYFSVKKFDKNNNVISVIKPDLIISCSMPNTVHLIASYFHKKYKIPYVMDYSDPWVLINDYPYNMIRKCVERRIEKKIVKKSIGYSFTTVGASSLYIKQFDIDKECVRTIYTGYNIMQISNLKKEYSPKYELDKNIRFTYGGALHETVRNPIPFLKALKSICDERIIFKIRTDNIDLGLKHVKETNTEKYVEVLPYLSFNGYYHEMLDSDLIILFGNKTVDQLPGKIFNLITTEKPIFYIYNQNDLSKDQAKPILDKYKNVIYARNEEESIKQGLIYFINSIGGYRNPINSEIYEFSEENQMRELSLFLEGLLNEKCK